MLPNKNITNIYKHFRILLLNSYINMSTFYQTLLEYKSDRKHYIYTDVISIEKIMQLSDLFGDYSEINEKRYSCSIQSIHHICPISLKQFSEGELVVELPCKHHFSKSNILKWLIRHSSTCPVCRFHVNMSLNIS